MSLRYQTKQENKEWVCNRSECPEVKPLKLLGDCKQYLCLWCIPPQHEEVHLDRSNPSRR